MSRFTPVISLNEAEQKLAVYLAKKRGSTTRGKGIPSDRRDPNHTDLEIDVEAAGAEIAFCKYFNCYPDTDTSTHKPADCIGPNGHTIDIKTTHYPDGMLLATEQKQSKPADLYVLMIGSFPDYSCAGCAPAGRLIQPENLRHVRPDTNPVYALTQDQLDNPERWMTCIPF